MTTKTEVDGFVYVPSIKFYVAKERTLLRGNWFESQKELHSKNQKMLTIPEFIGFLKFTKENHIDIYNEITEVRPPWRVEWLDADFKEEGKELIVVYHIFNKNGNIVKRSEVLDRNTLMEDKTPGISLQDYLMNNHTNQGLPTKEVESGDLCYWHPRSDNNSAAWFGANSDRADLDCALFPSSRLPYLGVRAVKEAA